MAVNQVSINGKVSVVPNSYVNKDVDLQSVEKANKDDKSGLLMKGLVAAGAVAAGVLLVRKGKFFDSIKRIWADSDKFAIKHLRLLNNKNLTAAKDVTLNRSGYLVDAKTGKKFTGRIRNENMSEAVITRVKDGIVDKRWKLLWDDTKASYRCAEISNIKHDPKMLKNQVAQKVKKVKVEKNEAAEKGTNTFKMIADKVVEALFDGVVIEGISEGITRIVGHCI